MKIAIIHYRAGRTDGVSLEISKRKEILEKLGHSVKIISGPENESSDYVIPELEFELPDIQQIKNNSFSYFQTEELDEDLLMAKVWHISRIIENRFYTFNSLEKFELLLVHNIFSHGRHIAAASAFAAVIENLKIPCLATNHDYYWEREEYQNPRFPEISNYLGEFVPYRSELITYVSINSIAVVKMLEKTGIKSRVFPDIFDFEQTEWRKDAFNADFMNRLQLCENDLIILQATRIVPRKAIESAIYFTEELTRKKELLVGKKLYNGKVITKESRVVLLLAGYAEKSAEDYLEKIRKLADGRIDMLLASHLIDAQRREKPEKHYSLWDAYVFADLVSYPSLSEGWGNQFIEAVFARKPIILFEYPVFKADITGEGYFYISLGDKIYSTNDDGLVMLPENVISKAVDKSLVTILSDSTKSMLDENFKIGKKFHSFKMLEQFLESFIKQL